MDRVHQWRVACCQIGTRPLTHCGLVMPYGDIEQGEHWLR